MTDKLLEVSMMLGDAIKKLDGLSAYKPKEKKKLYLWAFKSFGMYVQTEFYYEDEAEFRSRETCAPPHHMVDIQRLDSTMIEVDA